MNTHITPFWRSPHPVTSTLVTVTTIALMVLFLIAGHPWYALFALLGGIQPVRPLKRANEKTGVEHEDL